jgi:hypothetical protein
MKFEIPLPLQQQHEVPHEQLRQATRAGGEVGETAKTPAALMQHARTEEEVMYPAAVLVGQVLRRCLGQRVPGAA